MIGSDGWYRVYIWYVLFMYYVSRCYELFMCGQKYECVAADDEGHEHGFAYVIETLTIL